MPARTKQAASKLTASRMSDSETDFADEAPEKGAEQVKRRRGRPPSKASKPVGVTKQAATGLSKLHKKDGGSAKLKPDPKDQRHSRSPQATADAVEALLSESGLVEGSPVRAQPPSQEHISGKAGRRGAAIAAKGQNTFGDSDRKYEVLEERYRELRENSISEAERKFDQLQREAAESNAAAARIIADLKVELAAQRSLARAGVEFREQLTGSETRCEALQTKIDGLNKSLLEAKSEIKTLSSRLSASRSADPGNANAAATAPGRLLSSDQAQATQAKEDLYGDLTGLILRGVNLEEDEDNFDCIQTGRNGTVEKAASSESYSEALFTYSPQLDESRDVELMDVLPDYLLEEISFPRTHAAKFYARVIKSLMERLE